MLSSISADKTDFVMLRLLVLLRRYAAEPPLRAVPAGSFTQVATCWIYKFFFFEQAYGAKVISLRLLAALHGSSSRKAAVAIERQ